MSVVEGQLKIGEQVVRHNANFYELVTATSVWVEYVFVDPEGIPFESHCLYFNVIGPQPMQFSFDPRDVSDDERRIHGEIQSQDEFKMLEKYATSVWIRRSGAVDGTLRLCAMR